MSKLKAKRAARSRGGAWTPAQPTTEGGVLPVAWWDASLLAPGAVAAWTDLVAGTYTATQATEAQQPIAVAAAQNGLTVLRFTGAANQWLALPALNAGANWTALATYETSGATVAMPLLSCVASEAYAIIQYGDGKTYVHEAAAGTPRRIGWYTSAAGWRLETTRDDGVLSARRNGAGVGMTLFTHTSLGASITAIGRYNVSVYATGDAGEALIYGAALSPADITEVEAYLNAKWAVY